MMKRRIRTGAMVLALGVCAGAGAWSQEVDTEKMTVVTSEQLTYDASKKYALFEENVVVTDPQLQMTCNRLTLFFDEEGQPNIIRARGDVRISTENRRSHSGQATYEVATGKIVLTENPKVTEGPDILEAETITFWRDDKRMQSTGKVRVIISSTEGGAHKQLFGE